MGTPIDGDEASAGFGGTIDLSLDGRRVAIGSRFRFFDSGRVVVLEFVNGSIDWQPLGQTLDGPEIGGEFGSSVSLNGSGDKLAVGWARRSNNDGQAAGSAVVYQLNSSKAWIQIGQDLRGVSRSDDFGEEVRLSGDGNRSAVAIPGYGVIGRVEVFALQQGSWVQLGQSIDGEANGDFFGTSIDLSADGQVLAVGSPFNDGGGNRAGHARVFRFVSGVWSQSGNDIDGESASDNSGVSVSLNSDGTTIAIGAERNDGRSGDSSGHVRVYEYIDNDSWIQKGADIDGEREGDRSGVAVALSDTDVVVVGAPLSDDGGTNSGHARAFQLIDE